MILYNSKVPKILGFYSKVHDKLIMNYYFKVFIWYKNRCLDTSYHIYRPKRLMKKIWIVEKLQKILYSLWLIYTPSLDYTLQLVTFSKLVLLFSFSDFVIGLDGLAWFSLILWPKTGNYFFSIRQEIHISDYPMFRKI